MAKTRKQKEEIVKNLTDKLNKSKSLVFSNYHGLAVSEVQELKSQAKEEDVDYNVVKNSLFKLALKDSNFKDIKIKDFAGPRAIAFGYQDEVAPARILYNFAKKHKAMELLGGILDNKLLDINEIKSLAKLPSKDELIAKTVGTIKAPITGFVNVLA